MGLYSWISSKLLFEELPELKLKIDIRPSNSMRYTIENRTYYDRVVKGIYKTKSARTFSRETISTMLIFRQYLPFENSLHYFGGIWDGTVPYVVYTLSIVYIHTTMLTTVNSLKSIKRQEYLD